MTPLSEPPSTFHPSNIIQFDRTLVKVSETVTPSVVPTKILTSSSLQPSNIFNFDKGLVKVGIYLKINFNNTLCYLCYLFSCL